MQVQNIDDMLLRIEENAADELSFLLAVGPEYFSNAHLIRLKGQWEVKNALFHRLYKIWMKIGVSAPLWFGLWLLLDLLKVPVVGLVFLFLCPFSLFSFFGGMVLMRFLFKGKGHLDMVGDMIQQELQKRKVDHKSFQ